MTTIHNHQHIGSDPEPYPDQRIFKNIQEYQARLGIPRALLSERLRFRSPEQNRGFLDDILSRLIYNKPLYAIGEQANRFNIIPTHYMRNSNRMSDPAINIDRLFYHLFACQPPAKNDLDSIGLLIDSISPTKVKSMTYQNIIRMSNPKLQEDLKEFGVDAFLDDELKAAMEAAQAEERQRNMKEAVEEMISVQRATVKAMTDKVQKLREIRAREAALLQEIKALERCKLYAIETRNYIPLIISLGVIGVKDCFELAAQGVVTEVPKDWKPSKIENKTKPKSKSRSQ